MTSPLANVLLWGAASHSLAVLFVGLFLVVVGLAMEDQKLEEVGGVVAFGTLAAMLVLTALAVMVKLLWVW